MKVAEFLGAILEPPPQPEVGAVGELDLAPHQMRAVSTLVERVRTFGGALLADAVGLGKTRICLAAAEQLARLAREDDRRGPVWFLVPARLASTWQERARRAGFRDDHIELVTHTSMSRGTLPGRAPSLVVVDEAHRFRNPRTRRNRALTDLAAEAPLLLATATPVANDVGDLLALLRLFLGETDLRPWVGVDLSEAFETRGPNLQRLLERLVVRRTHWDDSAARRPRARLELLHYEPDAAEAWMWRHLGEELSSIRLVLLDGDWPRGLFVEHALRLWESGPRALVSTLHRLVAFHERWLEADAHGATITRADFQTLFGHRPQQSVLPFMFGELESVEASVDRVSVRADLDRLRALQSRAELAASDVARERALVDLLRREGGKLLVFTSFQQAAHSTFEALVAGLGGEGRVGLVTGSSALATGLGRVDAAEVLRRFSPGAFDLELPEHQSLDVLVATDCIAEGVDLHDCGRIVLSDLPYSPLRVEQRIGRLLRPGSPHDEVVVYLPRPRNWNDSLGMRRRLSQKLDHAEAAGTPFTPLQTEASSEPPTDDPLACLTRRDAWLRQLPRGHDHDPPPHYVRVTGAGDAVWLFACLDDGHDTEHIVVRVDPGGEAVDAWSRLLHHVDELIRFDPHITSVEPHEVRTSLVTRGRQLIDAHLDHLNAARVAPHPIAFDSTVYRAFVSLSEYAAGANLAVDRDAIRDRLLRPWPRGIEQRIAGWIDAPWRGLRQWQDLPHHPDGRRVVVSKCSVLDLRPAR